MRADRIGQAWPRGSRCRRARRLRLRRERSATASEPLAAGAIKQSAHTLDQHRAQRLFPIGVLIGCVAVILGIVFLLF
jgi:hypothetical protein